MSSVLDVNSLVSQLMTVENRPLTALQNKISKNNSQISGYGNIQNYLSQMQTALQDLTSKSNGFYATKTELSDENVVSFSPNGKSGSARYSLTVNNLATQDKYVTAEDSRYANKTDLVGAGVINFNVGGNTFGVTTTGTSTIGDLVSQINNNSDNKSMTASLVNDGSGYRMILSSKNTGASNAINISVTDSDGNSSDKSGLSRLASSNMVRTMEAKDASFVLDGVSMTSKTNVLSDVVDSGSITLKKAGSVNIASDVDQTATQEKIQKFVDSYNKLNTELKNARTTKTNALYGDANLSQIERTLQRQFNTENTGTGDSKYLSQIGITFDKNGTLSIDSKKLQAAMNSNAEGVANFFTQEGNIGDRLSKQIKEYTMPDGVLELRKSSLSKTGRYLEQQKTVLADRLADRETRLTAQYSKLDSNLSTMMNSLNQIQNTLY